MVKLTVMYGHPTDPDAFEEYYAGTHMPIAGKMSGFDRFEAAKVLGTPEGGKADFYRTAEIWWSSEEAMKQTLASSEGQATVADIPNFATGGVTVMVSAVEGA
jgi:uncharacterized protein (TIGR02118 family)